MTPVELPDLVAVSLVVTGALLAWCGGALALRSSARAAGALMVVAGSSSAVVAAVSGAGGSVPLVALAGVGVLLGLSVMGYPRWQLDTMNAVAAVTLVLTPGLSLADWAADGTDVVALLAGIPLLQAWWRLEAAGAADRRALTWVLAAAVPVCFVGLVLGMLEASSVVVAVYLPTFALIGVAAWLGATNPSTVDVRGVVAALATNLLAAVGLFTAFRLCWLLLADAGASAPEATAGLLAVALAFALEPLRRQLRLVADELLFGVRPDARAAAGRLALGVGDGTDSALDLLRAALVMPYAELRMEGLEVTTSGEPVEHQHAETLVADGQQVGELVVGLRPGDLRLSDADATVLALAAPLLVQTVRARALAESLQQARAATAAAREEERRRLRRDLHDGLGPRLSGIAFTADAAQLSAGEPRELERHIARVRAEAAAAIREIRELVGGLRPPALDEVGLVEAIRLQSAGLRGAGGRPLTVDVVGDAVSDLPAAVEVAAYRIGVEALTNSARHSSADRVAVHVDVHDGALHLEVREAGTANGAWPPGVGLTSMRERADELGGTLMVGDGKVRAVLPLDS